MMTQFWVAGVALLLCIAVIAGVHDAAAAAGADLCQRHRPGDALAGVRGHRAGAGAAHAAAGGAGAQRHVDERVAHHRAAGGRRADRQRRQRLRVRAQRGAVAGVAASSSCAGAASTCPARWAASAWSAPCASACSSCGQSRAPAGGAAAHLAVLLPLHRAAGAAAAGGARPAGRRRRHLHAAAGVHGRGRHRGRAVAAAAAPALVARRAGAARHGAAVGGHGRRGLRAQRLGGRAGHVRSPAWPGSPPPTR